MSVCVYMYTCVSIDTYVHTCSEVPPLDVGTVLGTLSMWSFPVAPVLTWARWWGWWAQCPRGPFPCTTPLDVVTVLGTVPTWSFRFFPC